ncbi:MAG: hypothetical protein ACOCXT_01005 [Candidatus Dojkabacteria bacterium]
MNEPIHIIESTGNKLSCGSHKNSSEGRLIWLPSAQHSSKNYQVVHNGTIVEKSDKHSFDFNLSEGSHTYTVSDAYITYPPCPIFIDMTPPEVEITGIVATETTTNITGMITDASAYSYSVTVYNVLGEVVYEESEIQGDERSDNYLLSIESQLAPEHHTIEVTAQDQAQNITRVSYAEEKQAVAANGITVAQPGSRVTIASEEDECTFIQKIEFSTRSTFYGSIEFLPVDVASAGFTLLEICRIKLRNIDQGDLENIVLFTSITTGHYTDQVSLHEIAIANNEAAFVKQLATVQEISSHTSAEESEYPIHISELPDMIGIVGEQSRAAYLPGTTYSGSSGYLDLHYIPLLFALVALLIVSFGTRQRIRKVLSFTKKNLLLKVIRHKM